MKTVKVLHDVAYEGLRPSMSKEQEANTPDWLEFLMGKCWVNIPSERPTFSEILSFIEEEMSKMEHEEKTASENGGNAPKRKKSREEMEADWSKRLGVVPRRSAKDQRGADGRASDSRKWVSTAY